MSKALKACKRTTSSKASQSQQQAAKQMQQLATKCSKKSRRVKKQNNVDAQQLRELLKNLVNSSFDQEKVMETLKSTNPTDPNYIILAQKQKDIKDNLKTAEDSLYALSSRSADTINCKPGDSSINSHIDQLIGKPGRTPQPKPHRNQQYAMTSMNNLALMLSEALDQLQNSMKNGKSGKGKVKTAIAFAAKKCSSS
jgi:hypothetical protein